MVSGENVVSECWGGLTANSDDKTRSSWKVGDVQPQNVCQRLEQSIGSAEDWGEGVVVWHQSRPCVVMRDMRPKFERITIKFLGEDIVKRKVSVSEIMSRPVTGTWREGDPPSSNTVTSGAMPAHLELDSD